MAPKVNVKITRQRNVNKPKKEKLKYSKWFVSITHNRSFRNPASDESMEFGDDFEAILNDVLNKQNLHFYVIDIGGKSYNDIDSISVIGGVEMSLVKKHWNSHTIIDARHRSKLRLDWIKIREDVEDNMIEMGMLKEGQHIHVDVKLIKSSGESDIMDYILKNQ